LGSKVYILDAIPEIGNYDSRQIARSLAGNRIGQDELMRALQIPRTDHMARVAPLKDTFQTLQSGGATLLDPAPYFCDLTTCSALFDGDAQYFDNNHIINSAAQRIRPLFTPLFAPDTSE
jgi:hypothetical protein